MVDQNILQDHAFLGKTAFECRGKTTLISKDEDDIATPCLRFGQDRRLSTADGHQLAHRFATTGLPDSDSPLLAEIGRSLSGWFRPHFGRLPTALREQLAGLHARFDALIRAALLHYKLLGQNRKAEWAIAHWCHRKIVTRSLLRLWRPSLAASAG